PRQLVDEIIVVDAGSADATVAVARKSGARVVVERRKGYGRACAAGVNATRTDIVAFLDGDGSDDSADLARVLGPLIERPVDLVLGSRSHVEGGAMPFYARLGNIFAAALISLWWGQKVTDLPSCKAIRRQDLLALGMVEEKYGWTIELIVKAARGGFRIEEVPLTYRARRGGKSKVSGNLRASVKAAFSILRVLVEHGFGPITAGTGDRPKLLDAPDQPGIASKDPSQG
ncbi:MAG TPA: glycosyltransferase, partial [Chloroflexota bacterium]|nr:glycosyltransferase [Chloroflexota bacterium]